MKVRWHIIEADGRRVESQIWEPETPTGKAILFCPGFPGRGATMFEQRHAAELVGQGYSIIVLRHAGTRLDTPDAPFMLNNSSRLQSGRTKGETHLNGGPSTVADWLLEPLTALHWLNGRYDRIDILGNSFGAVSVLYSLTRPKAPLTKIGALVLLAGAQGIDNDPAKGIMRIWSPALLANPLLAERVTLDPPASIFATLKAAYNEIPPLVKALPSTIAFKYVAVRNDEILQVSDAETFQSAIGGRGELLINETDRGYSHLGILAHDMPDYPTAKILELLK